MREKFANDPSAPSGTTPVITQRGGGPGAPPAPPPATTMPTSFAPPAAQTQSVKTAFARALFDAFARNLRFPVL